MSRPEWGRNPSPCIDCRDRNIACRRNVCGDNCAPAMAWDRLKAIEDILGDSYDLDGLRELVEADREGRYLCSDWPIGATVYRLNRELMRETRFIDGERYFKEVQRWCVVKSVYTWMDAAVDSENPGYRKFFLNKEDAIQARDELNRKETEAAIGGAGHV